MRTIVRACIFAVCLLSIYTAGLSQQVAKSIANSDSPEGGMEGFLEFRPSDYGTQKHPLIIFLHGIGERGNGTSQINSVATWAIPYFCSKGASMRFTVNGQTSSFVVLSPQLSTQYGYWPPSYVKALIAYAKANLSIDPNRIYITGLSLGGGGVWRAITDASNWDYSFDAGIAAAAPVCGTQEENDATFCGTIGANHLPIWAFHSMDDGTVGVGQTQHAQILAAGCGVTPAPKFTYYQTGNHSGAWINAYDTGHITTILDGGVSFTANPNLYEWLLSNSRSNVTTGNTVPTASAGAAQTITLPTSNITLTGTGAGTNGASISSSVWTKTSGPSAGTISAPASLSTQVTGLVQGTYVFTLTVTDNHGLTATSTVTITVNAAVASNTVPVANAGSAIAITLPQSIVTLAGTASGTNGASIASTAWSQLSGPSTGNIGSPGALTTWVINLVPGTYVFTLTVTDNHGLTASSNVTVTVNAAATGASPALQPIGYIKQATGYYQACDDGSSSGRTPIYASSIANGNVVYLDAALTTVFNGGWNWFSFTATLGGVVNQSFSIYPDGTIHLLTACANAVTIAPANQAPVANAGSAITITLPQNIVTLMGTASGTNGASIASTAWSQLSGPSTAVMGSPGALTTWVINLVPGSYVFTLTVTDNHGLTASSNITVNVNAGTGYTAPVANAGSAITITLPQNIVTLMGIASGTNGASVASTAWSQLSGPSTAVMGSAGALTTWVINLVPGSYVFTLTVTDNHGLTASSNITVNVNAGTGYTAPVANAGSAITITLPQNIVTLVGTASGTSGASVASTAWSQLSGPSTVVMGSAGALTTWVINLVPGTYVFSLTVTDNHGLTASSNVTVIVNAAAGTPSGPYTLLGYIKISTGSYQACDDASSSSSRVPLYGTTIANGATVYADAAGTVKYDGGWNWFSLTPAPGSTTPYGLVIYPIGTIGMLETCASASRSVANAATPTISGGSTDLASSLSGLKLNVYPNPVQSVATIQLNSVDNGAKTINLYDASGALKSKYVWQTVKGSNTFSLKNVAGLAAGLYIIDIRDSNGAQVGKSKFIKQ